MFRDTLGCRWFNLRLFSRQRCSLFIWEDREATSGRLLTRSSAGLRPSKLLLYQRWMWCPFHTTTVIGWCKSSETIELNMKSKKATSSCPQGDILRSAWKYLRPVNSRKNTWVNNGNCCCQNKRKIVVFFKNNWELLSFLFFLNLRIILVFWAKASHFRSFNIL